MIQEIICLAILYTCLIGWLNAPKPTTALIAVQPETTTEPKPQTAFTVTAPKAIAYHPLETMPIRSLYRLASDQKIKGYKAMQKAELVAALNTEKI